MLPTPALLLLIAVLCPLVSFALLAGIGRRMGPLAGYVGMALALASWVASLIALVAWFNGGQYAGAAWGPEAQPICLTFRFIPTGGGVDMDHPGFLDVGIYLDSLTIAMFNMVCLIAVLTHLFSIPYMAGDESHAGYFTSLSLVNLAMLGLLIAATLLQMLVFWQILTVGTCLLIGCRHERGRAVHAAAKCLLANTIADVGFFLGLGIAFCYLGNTTLLQLSRWLSSAGSMGGGSGVIALPNGMTMSAAMLTTMGVALFCSAAGKAALLPLHGWLISASEAPAPAAALINSAAMGAAGIYFLGRIFPLLTPEAKLVIAIVGAATMIVGAVICLAQNDIKILLSYNSMSQLGLMALAIGIGSWGGALLLLVTHAFSKALLLLGAGSVIRAAGGERDMAGYGGMLRRVPVTAITFAIGALAISGTPFFSGYYAQELILRHAGAYAAQAVAHHRSAACWLLPALAVATAYLTAFGLARCWMLCFWGKRRRPVTARPRRETISHWLPLVTLAGLAVISASQLLYVRHMLWQSKLETEAYCRESEPRSPNAPSFSGFDQAWPMGIEEGEESIAAPMRQYLDAGGAAVHPWARWAFAVGIAAAIAMYFRGYAVARFLTRAAPLRWICFWLRRGMFLDEIFSGVFAAVATALVRLVAAVDRSGSHVSGQTK